MGEFKTDRQNYIHYSKQQTDTGVQIDLLQEYIFTALDTFQSIMENRTIENELESWLMFLSTDDPERILELIEKYPEFRELYEDIYRLCLNTERVMEMFSEELKILDENTVKYMIDEYQSKMDDQISYIKMLTNFIPQLELVYEQTILKEKRSGNTVNKTIEKLMSYFGMDRGTAQEKITSYWK